MRKLLLCLPLVLVACGSSSHVSSQASSPADHAKAACRAGDDASAAWSRFHVAAGKEYSGDLVRPTADPVQTEAKGAAASDIASADQRMTAEAAQAAAGDPKWDILNRSMSTISVQNRNGGTVDAFVDSTVDAECAKARAS